jgi:hypothetical protein
MNKDIRVTVGFADHPKTVKLIRKRGEEAFRCLIRLWLYAAEYRPSGALAGMMDDDIAIASGWGGNEAEWVQSLVDVGFLDGNPGAYSLHDWETHNPFACHAAERSERASKAARAKWDRIRNAEEMREATKNDAICNANDMLDACVMHEERNAPSPSPSPSPSPNPCKQSSLGVNTPREGFPEPRPVSEIVKIGNACLEAVGHDPVRFVGNFSAVQAWLNSGFSSDEIMTASAALAARPGFVTPGNPMAWLAKAMPDEIARQRRAAEKDKVDDLGMPIEPEIDWKNHPIYRGVI